MTDIDLHLGYVVAVDDASRQQVVIRAPDGRVCLTIRLGPDGPQVVVEAASLELVSQGKVAVTCESFEVNAREDIVLDAGRQVRISAKAELLSEAVAQTHTARLGGIELLANDDVSLEGERINLNTPTEERSRRTPAVLGSAPLRKKQQP